MFKNKTCPFCFKLANKITTDNYYLCLFCQAIFLDKKLHLSQESVKNRYKEHNDNVYDKRYRQFVSSITSAILKEQDKDKLGLDFGAGTGPVISTVLKEKKYKIFLYDPYFLVIKVY